MKIILYLCPDKSGLLFESTLKSKKIEKIIKDD